jgi:histidyl-tRNA synthetase
MCQLRLSGISCDTDQMGRSLKAQMKYSNKYPAHYVAIIGDDEVKQNKVMLKNMTTGNQELVDVAEVRLKLQLEMED